MKVAYLTGPGFFDIDFSLIQMLKKKVELFVFIVITPLSKKFTAINIDTMYPHSGIYKADIYPEISAFADIIDIERTYIINLTCGRFYALKNYIIGFKFLRLLFRLNIDILHTTYYFTLWNMVLYLFKKKVITIHDPILHSDNKSVMLLLYRKITFLLIHNFILLNKNQKDVFIQKYGLLNKHIYISRLGVYTCLTRYTKNQKISAGTEYVLFFGRITSYKGLEYLFPAMERIHDAFPNINLVIAGNGAFYFDISAYTSCDYIKIINRYIPNEELASLIDESLFVICPYNDATQSGVVMTSFAFCKPIIATNTGGMNEYIENGKSGLLIEPRSVERLAGAMSNLLGNRSTITGMRQYIFEKYFTGSYSWDTIASNLSEFYKTIK